MSFFFWIGGFFLGWRMWSCGFGRGYGSYIRMQVSVSTTPSTKNALHPRKLRPISQPNCKTCVVTKRQFFPFLSPPPSSLSFSYFSHSPHFPFALNFPNTPSTQLTLPSTCAHWAFSNATCAAYNQSGFGVPPSLAGPMSPSPSLCNPHYSVASGGYGA